MQGHSPYLYTWMCLAYNKACSLGWKPLDICHDEIGLLGYKTTTPK